MKNCIATLLALMLVMSFCASALAQDDTEASLERLRNAIVGFAERTGDSLSEWSEDAANNISTWFNGSGDSAEAWAQGVGESIEKWIQDAANGASAFFEQADVKEWIAQAGQFFASAGDEISKAWEAFTSNANAQEAQKAYATLKAWMENNDVSPSIREAVDGMAKAAGIKIDE